MAISLNYRIIFGICIYLVTSYICASVVCMCYLMSHDTFKNVITSYATCEWPEKLRNVS